MQIFSALPAFKLESALAADLVARAHTHHPGFLSLPSVERDKQLKRLRHPFRVWFKSEFICFLEVAIS